VQDLAERNVRERDWYQERENEKELARQRALEKLKEKERQKKEEKEAKKREKEEREAKKREKDEKKKSKKEKASKASGNAVLTPGTALDPATVAKSTAGGIICLDSDDEVAQGGAELNGGGKAGAEGNLNVPVKEKKASRRSKSRSRSKSKKKRKRSKSRERIASVLVGGAVASVGDFVTGGLQPLQLLPGGHPELEQQSQQPMLIGTSL